MRDLTTLHTSLTTSQKGGAHAAVASTRKGRSAAAAAKSSSGNVNAAATDGSANVKQEDRGTGSGDEDATMLNGAMATTATSSHSHRAAMQGKSQYRYDMMQPRPGTSVGYEHAPPRHLIPGSTGNDIDSFRRDVGQQHSFRGNDSDHYFQTGAGSFLGRGHDSDSPSPVSPAAAVSGSGGPTQSFLEQQHQQQHPYPYHQHQHLGSGGGADGHSSGRYESPPIASITPSCPGLPASGSSGRPRTSSGVASTSVYPSATNTAAGGQQQLHISPGSGSGGAATPATATRQPPRNYSSTDNGGGFQSQYHQPTYQRQHSGGQGLALATKNLAIGPPDEGSQVSGNHSVQHNHHQQQQSSFSGNGEPQRPSHATAASAASGSGAGGLPSIAEIVTPPGSSQSDHNDRERDRYHEYEPEHSGDPSPSSPTSHQFNFDANRIHGDVYSHSHSYDKRSSEFHLRDAFNSRRVASTSSRGWSGGRDGRDEGRSESFSIKSKTYEQQPFEARTFDSKSALYQHGASVRGGAASGARPGKRDSFILPSREAGVAFGFRFFFLFRFGLFFSPFFLLFTSGSSVMHSRAVILFRFSRPGYSRTQNPRLLFLFFRHSAVSDARVLELVIPSNACTDVFMRSLLGTAPASYYQSPDSRQLTLPPLTAGAGSVRRSGIRDGLSTSAGVSTSGRLPSLALPRSNAIQLPLPVSSSRPSSSSGGAGTSLFFATRRPGTGGGSSHGQPLATYTYPGQPPSGSSGMGSLSAEFGARQPQYIHAQHQQQHFAAQPQPQHLQHHVSSESPFSFHAPEPDTTSSASYYGQQQQSSQQGEHGESVRRGTKRPRADSDAGYGGGEAATATAAGGECNIDDRGSGYQRGDGHFELSREREPPRPQSRRLAVTELCDVSSFFCESVFSCFLPHSYSHPCSMRPARRRTPAIHCTPILWPLWPGPFRRVPTHNIPLRRHGLRLNSAQPNSRCRISSNKIKRIPT